MAKILYEVWYPGAVYVGANTQTSYIKGFKVAIFKSERAAREALGDISRQIAVHKAKLEVRRNRIKGV